MIIHIDKVKTQQGVRKGLEYQLKDKENPNKVRGKLWRGNPLEVIAWSKTSNSEKVKAFSVLVSFSESKEELEKKLKERGKELDDLIHDIEKFLFAGYKKEEVAYTIISHEDTDNFHFHIYVANNFASTGKTLKFWFTPKDLETFRKYIDIKYGLNSPDLESKETISRKIGSKKWQSLKHKEREILREEIHELVLTGINIGLVKDRQSLIKFLENQGLKVRRKGKNYISVEIEGIKIRLKGGIYDENFRVEEILTRATERVRENLFREFEEIRNRIREYYRRKDREIEERYGNIRSRLKENPPEGDKTITNIEKERNRNQSNTLQNKAFRIWSDGRRGNDGDFAIFVKPISEEIKEIKRKVNTYKNEAERLKHEIELPQLLSYLGIPFYYSQNYIKTNTPWRWDKEPSFIAHKKDGKWLWYDAGRNQGGSVIDFVMRYFDYSFKEALEWLEENELEIKHTQIKAKKLQEVKEVRVINLRKPDADKEDLKWLTKVWKLKHLPPCIWIGDLRFKKEVIRETEKGFPEIKEIEQDYLNPVLVLKTDQALYWRNINPSITDKGWLTSNQPVVIENPNSKNLYVVEGLTDYITLYQIDPEGSFLILGTAQNVDKVIPYLKEQEKKGKNIVLALDNDETGIKATKKIQRKLKTSVNLAKTYKGYKDFAEFYLNADSEDLNRVKEDLEREIRSIEQRRKRPSRGFGLSL